MIPADTTSQDKIVLWHMTKHKYITSMDAFSLYGITRLSAKIYNLRQDGHKIGMVWEESVNRYGVPVRYGRYFIEKNKRERNEHTKIWTLDKQGCKDKITY